MIVACIHLPLFSDEIRRGHGFDAQSEAIFGAVQDQEAFQGSNLALEYSEDRALEALRRCRPPNSDPTLRIAPKVTIVL